MDTVEQFEMAVKIKCPPFGSGKEEHRYSKALITAIDRQFNKHTMDLGEWPLVVQIFEEKSTISHLLSLRFAKALEPNENALETMNKIVAYMKKELHLQIHSVQRNG